MKARSSNFSNVPLPEESNDRGVWNAQAFQGVGTILASTFKKLLTMKARFSNFSNVLLPEERNDMILRNVQAFQGAGTILASYPRSGSIWLRSLLYDYATLRAGGSITPDPPADLHFFSPRIELPTFTEYLAKPQYDWKIITTHLRLEALQDVAHNKHWVVLFRNPVDALVSAFNKRTSPVHKTVWRDKKGQAVWRQQILERGIDGFCLDRIEHWTLHAMSFRNAYDENPKAFCFVAYESLHRAPCRTLNNVLRFGGFTPNEAWINQAVENRALHKVKSKAGTPKRRNNFGTGQVGSGENDLKPETLAQMDRLTGSLLARLQEAERLTRV